MKRIMDERGFTLIELLLVVVVMGLMLAVIVPRGQRATTDVKYSIVRQNASELASFANGWVEQEMLAQDDTQLSRSTSTRGDYLTSLTTSLADGLTKGTKSATWIADNSRIRSNWNTHNLGAGTSGGVGVQGRKINGADKILPETTVEGIIEPGKIPLNPFSATSVFNIQNNPVHNTSTGVVAPGAIACGQDTDKSITNSTYVALIFQGTDSTTTANADHSPTINKASFHAGMDESISGLRNGVFMSRYQN